VSDFNQSFFFKLFSIVKAESIESANAVMAIDMDIKRKLAIQLRIAPGVVYGMLKDGGLSSLSSCGNLAASAISVSTHKHSSSSCSCSLADYAVTASMRRRSSSLCSKDLVLAATPVESAAASTSIRRHVSSSCFNLAASASSSTIRRRSSSLCDFNLAASTASIVNTKTFFLSSMRSRFSFFVFKECSCTCCFCCWFELNL